jgi:uncharacterized protein with PQ loop repeat
MFTGQQLAWIFSIISNCMWLIVFVPQFYKNYKNKNSHAISLLLLFCLLLGDILAMTSGYLKKLNIVVIYTAVYHIILNSVIICQILYYRRLSCISYNQERVSLLSSSSSSSSSLSSSYISCNESLSSLVFTPLEIYFYITSVCFIILTHIFIQINNNYNELIGNILAWIATFIFIFSRIPQILLNFKRKSTEGLSITTFIIANISNMFFMLSILIILYDLNINQYNNYIIENIQWIIGGGVTTIFDGIIFYQFYKYRLL